MRKYFPFEYALAVYKIIEIGLLFAHFSGKSSSNISKTSLLLYGNMAYATLIYLKWKYEGWRAASAVCFLSQIANSTFAICQCWFSLLIAVALAVFQVYLIYFFRIRPLHNPRGRHHVGFTTFMLNKTTSCSIFYPCVERKVKVKPKWLPFEDYWRRMHDTHKKDVSKPGKAPSFFFKFFMDFMKKIEMPFIDHDAPVIDPEELEEGHRGTFPVLIFSHGLAAHANCYISILSEIASFGFIVISPDHEEEISNRYADWEMIREYRFEQLKERFVTLKEILSLLEHPSKLNSIFKKKLKLDLKRVSVAGHSFGGATAIYTAMKDKRVTGVCMSFDPVSFAIPDEMRSHDFERPFLSINSEDFYRLQYPQFDNDRRLNMIFESNTTCKEFNLNFYLRHSNHIDCADLVLFLPGEFKLFKVIKSIYWCHTILDVHIDISTAFIREMQITAPQKRFSGKQLLYGHKSKNPDLFFFYKDIEHLL